MTFSRRLVSALLAAAILVFLGMLFWPFVVNNILQPIGLVVWLLVRILVLSIHQKYVWYALILVAFVALFRLLPQAPPDAPSPAGTEKNATLTNIEHWRSLFAYSRDGAEDEKILKRRLTDLVISLYASKQRTAKDFRVHEALEQGRIPLPGNIHTFLFAQEAQGADGPLRNFFQSLLTTPRTWVRRWTGQEKAEHTRRIEEVLHFMETSLEIKHDDRNLS